MRYASAAAAAAAVEIIPGSVDEQAGNTANSKYPLSIARCARLYGHATTRTGESNVASLKYRISNIRIMLATALYDLDGRFQ